MVIMNFLRRPAVAVSLGAFIVAMMAFGSARMNASAMADQLAQDARAAIAEAGGGNAVRAIFRSAGGQPSRHPVLSGGEDLNDAARDRIAKAVATLPAVGGIRWADGDALIGTEQAPLRPLHCQEDVEALLRARTIRFEGGSARIDLASSSLVDEVAAALRPCLGSIIAITGHTDTSGTVPGNLALSRERADAVRQALIQRGIPADGLRARGLGSRMPVTGLDPADPANRRIEFSVIATEPIKPTPVDTPGPR